MTVGRRDRAETLCGPDERTEMTDGYRLHFRAQTATRNDPSTLNVALWIGKALCADPELRKIGELRGLTHDEWRVLKPALFSMGLGEDDKLSADSLLVDGAEGGTWDLSKP